ncbi:MAG: ProQ/FINO family protein [Pseudomonadota bacterium]|nr:ProQ/FINO family protein [Pseudomonadota bacterium]
MKGKTPPEERMRAEAFLRARYPNTFFPPGQVKPLEVGIKGRLIEDLKDNLPEDISLRAIYVALHYYCCTKEYKKARKVLGNPRLNLQGEVIGEVNETDIDLGKQRNAENRRIRSERKARERAIEQARLEKKLQAEKMMAKRSAKAKTAKNKRRLPNKLQTVKTTIKPTKNRAYTDNQQPTITVRKRKVLTLPKKDKKVDNN